MSGKFYELIVSSYASKGIQKALKSTIASIITMIFEEVIIFLKKDTKQYPLFNGRPIWKLLLPEDLQSFGE
jgi:hypothetical protein